MSRYPNKLWRFHRVENLAVLPKMGSRSVLGNYDKFSNSDTNYERISVCDVTVAKSAAGNLRTSIQSHVDYREDATYHKQCQVAEEPLFD